MDSDNGDFFLAATLMKKLRAFLAVPLPKRLKSDIQKLVRELSPAISGVRWVEPEGLHITLKFFGEIVELQTVEISRCLQKIAAQHTAFDITLAGLGAFPSVEKARTLWAGVDDLSLIHI